jgi:DNA topoisomerase-2
MEQKYKKHELRTHIYELPDTYIGSTEITQLDTYIYNNESKRMIKKTITYVPGLYKIYDEIVVNSLDQITRLKQAELNKELDNIKHVKYIKFTIERETGYIEIENDGDGIDIDLIDGMYIPQMILGELLTSSNYKSKEAAAELLVGGKNGFGGKLTNIFSLEFTAETVDHRRKKKYKQTWKDNMKVVGKPIITSYSKTPYTKIRFLPDYKRFGLDGLTDDIYDLFYRRALDACATSDSSVSVYFNNSKLEIKSFEKYADLYLGGDKKVAPRVYEACGERWEFIAAPNESGQFEQVSFVNGINTSRGGKHVDYLKNQIAKEIGEMISSKLKKTVKPQHITDNLFLMVKSLIVNPSFDSQTKDILTTQITKFGSKCELSDKFIKELYKSGIVDKAVSISTFHEGKKASKTDGKKTSRILVDKLDDANYAGTRDSEKCTLILTEGDSAKALAISGLSVVGRDYYGVFPLKGKVMNVRGETATRISENDEISNLKKIMGLQNGKVYKDLTETRYGHIMLLTDSDDDGFHIKGLLFNLFQTMWSSLYKQDSFLVSMLTPILKARHKESGAVESFYILNDFLKWKDNQLKKSEGLRGWKFKYYKGLGTSTSEEAKEYFREMKKITYKYTGKDSDEAIDLAFNKKRADDRKDILIKFDKENTLDYTKREVAYEEFVDKELFKYSTRDNERAISHIADGFKESTRKIAFAAFKRKIYNEEVKVAQFGAYVAEKSAYHHGEASLMKAIVGMNQSFVGSNNISVFEPKGQFGTRIAGGEDASSPRYIFTLLRAITKIIFNEEDFNIVKYINDDGMLIEPEYYMPILPMILVNGAKGIGTGFSNNVPNYNPTEVINQCILIARALKAENIDTKESLSKVNDIIDNVELIELIPWYLGFTGKIIQKKEGSYESHGVYKWLDDETIEISELPIGTWTADYNKFLTDALIKNHPALKDYEKHYTDKSVKFILKLYPGIRKGVEINFDTEFKLVTSKDLNTTNIHLYNSEGKIQKYNSQVEVLKDWAKLRITKYYERKEYQLKILRMTHKIIAAKVKFIKQYIDGTIELVGKKITEVNAQLKALKYPMANDDGEDIHCSDDSEEIVVLPDANGEEIVKNIKPPSYNYLTDMKLRSLTNEEKAALEKKEHNIKMQIDELEAKTLPDIWLSELDTVNTKWIELKTEIEEEYRADKNSERPVTLRKKKVSSRK